MHFTHSEILFFLFLLVIPILIHLFQLQKFKTEAFTNVKFLKKIELESRKSSKLKKFLILISRLLALACLVLAFSQPFLKKTTEIEATENIIYLDNSMSMQAKKSGGSDILNGVKNTLLEEFKENDAKYTLITNTKTIDDLNFEGLSKSLMEVNFDPVKKDVNHILLQINDNNQNSPATASNIYLISDFQRINNEVNDELLIEKHDYHFVDIQPKDPQNISIDSVWTLMVDDENIRIKSIIRSQQLAIDDLSISLFMEGELYGKTSINLATDESKEVEFTIPASKTVEGHLSLNDHRLAFDNKLYFKIPEKEKPKVLIIGVESDYLNRIYQQDEFELLIVDPEQLDPSILMKQDLIILSEMLTINKSLTQSLNYFVKDKGNLVIIPAINSDIFSYNNLLTTLHIGNITSISKEEKRVTGINYDHPFFKNVFKQEKRNFQYPISRQSFNTDLSLASSLLFFEDESVFISESNYFDNKVYWVASPLSDGNSNFINSPLIVPVFYNFSILKVNSDALYHTIGIKNEISVVSDSISNQALKMASLNIDFIPLQKKNTHRVNITTTDLPLVAGIYNIKDDKRIYDKVAYNYNRSESILAYNAVNEIEGVYDHVYYYNSIREVTKALNDQHDIRALWQLFVIFAMVFLILEILLQKFLKN